MILFITAVGWVLLCAPLEPLFWMLMPVAEGVVGARLFSTSVAPERCALPEPTVIA